MISKRSVFNCFVILALLVGMGACQPPPATSTASPPDTPTPEHPTFTPAPEEPPKIEEPPLPVIPSERDHHPYNWQPEDVKGLDPWGDSESDPTDIIAIYQREMNGNFEFRLDIMNFEADDELAPIYFAIDFLEGGSKRVESGSSTSFDIEWDLLVSVVDGEFKLYDSTFSDISDQLVTTEINHQLDFVFFAISEEAFTDWDGEPFQIQALLLNDANSAVLDQTTPVATDNTTGRAKLVLTFGNITLNQNPWEAAMLYDGFGKFSIPGRENEREGERRGSRYMLDATERYEIPITINDVQIEGLPGEEYLRVLERFRTLANKGLLDLNMTTGYAHWMPWQPDDVDVKAIEIASELREGLDLPISTVFYPYDGLLTSGDIQVIKEAGFEAIYGELRARDSFFGWIENLDNPAAHKDEIEILRKIHQFNGMKFFFHTEWHNYESSGLMTDNRWDTIEWPADWPADEFDYFAGTDQGLHYFWRRVLHDMAMDPDQEQFFTIGTDMLFSSWLLPDVIEWNFQWLASHPWIEVTTFSNIVDRDWEVIDHGELDTPPDKPLMRFPRPDSFEHFLSYFPQHYYGGISDGYDPSVPAGTEIEAYYDYIPILRDGEMIPSGRIMGDDKTPDSIVYETLANLRESPNNPVTTIAWLSYFTKIGEQAAHNGSVLSEEAGNSANFMGQVNKIVAAAHWAAEAERGTLGSDTLVYEKDLDLDGELEYVMHNEQVFAIFENDGGRLEYAFAYDAEYGPVQLISPRTQYTATPETGNHDFQNGEVAIALEDAWAPDGTFVEDIDLDGRFKYEPLIASIEGGSLTFRYETLPVSKTLALEGDTIHVHYERGSVESLNIGIAAAVNWLGIFDKDWVRNFEPIKMQEVIGWGMTSGGAVLLNVEDKSNIQTASFYDSPARVEMQQREDESTYPEGHAMCFPCSSIRIWDTQETDFSLTLSAAPIDKSAYTPIPTPTLTSTATPPTATLSPEQEVSHYIYDDAARAGWNISAWDGEIDLSSESVVHKGQSAIEANLNGWGNIGLWTESLDTSPYLYLEFYIHGGSQGGQQINVMTQQGEEELANLAISDYIQYDSLPQDEWLLVRIPIEHLNPDNLPLTGILIVNSTDEKASTFYVDDIRFVSAEQ